MLATRLVSQRAKMAPDEDPCVDLSLIPSISQIPTSLFETSSTRPLPASTESPPERRCASNRLVFFGGIGAGIAALCCFTPLLVWVLAGLGLAGLVAYIDVVLLPILAVTLIALYLGVNQVRRERSACDSRSDTPDSSKHDP